MRRQRPGRFASPVVRAGALSYLLFASIAALVATQQRPLTTPHVALQTDAANIASFAAARSHRANFAGDLVLAEARVTDFYTTFSTWSAQRIGDLSGDYGLAMYLLLPVAVLLFLLGFHGLLRILGCPPLTATIGALSLLVSVTAISGTYWGGFAEAQPRFLYSALLPFALAGIVRMPARARSAAAWFAFLGALTYVHPVSGPPVAFALWVALGWTRWRHQGLRRGGSSALAAGLAFLAVAAPFVLAYVGSTTALTVPPESRAAYVAAVAEHYNYYTNVPYVLLTAGLSWRGPGMLLLLAAIVATWRLRRSPTRTGQHVRFLFAFGIGLGIVAIAVPMIDWSLAQWRGGSVALLDLPRNTRYSVPIVLIIVFLYAEHWMRGIDLSRRARAAVICALGAFWLLCNASSPYAWRAPIDLVVTTVLGREDARFAAWQAAAADDAALASYLRERTGATEIALLTDYDLHATRRARFAGLRSIAVGPGDWATLAYADYRRFLDWVALDAEVRAARSLPDPGARLDAWIAIAGRTGASRLVVGSDLADVARWRGLPIDLVTERYRVVRLAGASGADAAGETAASRDVPAVVPTGLDPITDQL